MRKTNRLGLTHLDAERLATSETVSDLYELLKDTISA